MSDNLQKLGALAFALVAISVSGAALQLQGQVSNPLPINDFTATQTAAGVTLPKDEHNFFTCNTGGAVSVTAHDLGPVRAWTYEFTGNEPPFTGDFWISSGELAVNPQYASINTLTTYKEGRRYYSMGEDDLYFKCGEGLSRNEYCGDSVCQSNENVNSCANDCNVCGDGVVFGLEECDDNGGLDGDGCNAYCQVELGYTCSGNPSSCSIIVPLLPGQGGSSSGGSSSPNNSNTCQDTDGGHTPGTRGTATINGQSQTDLCSGNTLSEYNCQFGFMEGLIVDCSATGQVCQNGACVTAGTTSSSNSPGSSPGSSSAAATHTECNYTYNRCEEVQGSGADQCTTDSDCGADITLESASIDAGNITLKYSKDFTTCARIRKRGVAFSPVNFPCPQGDNFEATRSLSAYSDPLNVGDEIRLCHGNNGNLCSNYVTITGGVVSSNTGNLYVTQDATPLRNRQLLGGALGETVMRLEFHAEGEDIDITNIRLINSTVIDSIDRLELYTDGTSTPFAVATRGGCAGVGGGNVFCANMQSQQLVIPDGQEIDVLVRPSLKTDVQGGTSNEVVAISLIHPSNNIIAIEARGDSSSNDLAQNDGDSTANGEIFIGTNIPGANGNYPEGIANRTVHSKITSITNANPDANGTAVAVGQSAIGQFKFTAAAHQNSEDGNNDAVLDGIIFSVNATNVAISAQSFTLYNKADQTQTVSCQGIYPGGQPITGNNISGSFFVSCRGLDVSNVNTEVDQGTDSTFVLEADIVSPNIASANGGVSTLQVSIDTFDQPGPNMNIDFGIGDSHIRWFDRDGSTNATFHWIEYPETIVKSTSYNS